MAWGHEGPLVHEWDYLLIVNRQLASVLQREDADKQSVALGYTMILSYMPSCEDAYQGLTPWPIL